MKTKSILTKLGKGLLGTVCIYLVALIFAAILASSHYETYMECIKFSHSIGVDNCSNDYVDNMSMYRRIVPWAWDEAVLIKRINLGNPILAEIGFTSVDPQQGCEGNCVANDETVVSVGKFVDCGENKCEHAFGLTRGYHNGKPVVEVTLYLYQVFVRNEVLYTYDGPFADVRISHPTLNHASVRRILEKNAPPIEILDTYTISGE